MPTLHCLILIRSPNNPVYEVLEIIPKVWDATWQYEHDTYAYDYLLSQCKHPDTPDAPEDNTVVKFRFKKDKQKTVRFSWFENKAKAEEALEKILDEEKKKDDAKVKQFKWTVRDILEVHFDHLEK